MSAQEPQHQASFRLAALLWPSARRIQIRHWVQPLRSGCRGVSLSRALLALSADLSLLLLLCCFRRTAAAAAVGRHHLELACGYCRHAFLLPMVQPL
jgi:hypothetical protein